MRGYASDASHKSLSSKHYSNKMPKNSMEKFCVNLYSTTHSPSLYFPLEVAILGNG